MGGWRLLVAAACVACLLRLPVVAAAGGRRAAVLSTHSSVSTAEHAAVLDVRGSATQTDTVGVWEHLHGDAKSEAAATAAVEAEVKQWASADGGALLSSYSFAESGATVEAESESKAESKAEAESESATAVDTQAATAAKAAAAGTSTTDAHAEAEGVGGVPDDVVFGRTPPGRSPWRRCGYRCLYMDVDTRVAGFTKTPVYVSTLEGNGWHDLYWGVGTIGSPSRYGFRVHVWSHHGRDMPPHVANAYKWRINWAATTNPKFGGRTSWGGTRWRAWQCHWGSSGCHGVWTDVSMAAARFPRYPNIITNLASVNHGSLYRVLGQGNPVNVRRTSFRIHLYTPWHNSLTHMSNLRWSVNWIATTTGRGSFFSGRTSRYAWRSNWWINVNFRIRRRQRQNIYWLAAVSSDHTAGAYTARGTNAIWRTTGQGGLLVMTFTHGWHYARRYNYQVNFIGGRPFAELLGAAIRRMSTTVKVLARTAGQLAARDRALAGRARSARSAAASSGNAAARARSQGAALKRDVSRLSGQRQSLRAAIDALNRRAVAVKAAIDAAVAKMQKDKEAAEGAYKPLVAKRDGLARNVESAVKAVARSAAAATKASEEESNARTDAAGVKTEVAAAASRYKARAEQLKTLEATEVAAKKAAEGQLEVIVAEAKRVKDKEGAVTAAESKARSEVDLMTRQVDNLKTKAEDLRGEAAGQRTELAGLRKDAAEHDSTYKAALRELQGGVPDLESQIRMQMDLAEREASKFKEEKAELVTAKREAEAKVGETHRAVSAAQAKLNAAEVEREVAAHVVSDTRAAIAHTKAELTSVEARADAEEAKRAKEVADTRAAEERRVELAGEVHRLRAAGASALEAVEEALQDGERSAGSVKQSQLHLKLAQSQQALIPQVMQRQMENGGAGGGTVHDHRESYVLKQVPTVT